MDPHEISMNVQTGRKDKKRQAAADQYDFHTVLSKLLLKAEKSPDSLERMLAVSRYEVFSKLCWAPSQLHLAKAVCK